MSFAWPQFSISRTLMLVTAGLTLIIALVCGYNVARNAERLHDLQLLSDASDLSYQLFDAIEQLSLERDLAIAMLHASDPVTAEELAPRLAETRRAVDETLDSSREALDSYQFSELRGISDGVAARMETIRSLRRDIDAALIERPDGGVGELSTRWSDEVSALVSDTQALWAGFIGHYVDVDAIATLHTRYRHLLRSIRDGAAVERSVIGRLIAENSNPDQVQIESLLRSQGGRDLAWRMVRVIAEQSGLYQELSPYFADAESHYAVMHGMMWDMFYTPGASPAPYPISAELWFELSMQADETLAALSDASAVLIRAHLEDLIAEAEAAIAVQLAVLVLALLLCAASIWIVLRRVIRPINDIIAALLRATRGEPVDFTPADNRQDEIGKLGQVFIAFQEKSDEVARTAAELTQSQSRLRAVVDHAVDGLITMDSSGRIGTFNPASERIFGYTASEVVGRNIRLLTPSLYEEGDSDDLLDYVADESAAASGTGSHEIIGRRKDGSTFPLDISLSTFPIEGAQMFLALVRDVTPRKQAEETLLSYTHALERSNKELDDFAYIASHDLKEPLRGIHNHARFLIEDNAEKLDADSAKRLDRLVYLSQRMERLVNDLLYFSRLGRQEMAIQRVEIEPMIADITSTLDHFIEENNVRITVKEKLPAITCDKPRVAELFRNLITNAVKYNDSAEKAVEIGFLDAKADAAGAILRNVFYVRDNGRGIDPEFHTEIFRIFKRLQADKPGAQEGTGVGLTFVKKIVERHGGKIWIESAPGDGATFYFTLEGSRDDQRRTRAA